MLTVLSDINIETNSKYLQNWAQKNEYCVALFSDLSWWLPIDKKVILDTDIDLHITGYS